MSEGRTSALRLWIKPSLVWLALLLLLGATVTLAYVPLGAFNTALSYMIAAGKAALVFIFFMHLNRSPAFVRLVAVTGFLWLTFLFSLTFADYVTRDWNGGGTSLSAHPARVGAGERGSYPQERLPLNPRLHSDR
jgi:caa(3)-type oxidase subunit IV